jgi:ABC-type microcin C transport system permease subunit YejB
LQLTLVHRWQVFQAGHFSGNYPMHVNVIVITSVPPTEKDLEDLRFAASALTSQQDSITTEINEENGQFLLIASFKMKTTAQYKVVDAIAKQFEFSLGSLEGYQDMQISFLR